MEAASLPAESTPPWRRAALVAAGIAIAELAAIVVLGLALLAGPLARTVRAHVEPHARSHPAAQAVHAAPARRHARRAVHAPAKPRLSRARTHVLVLNGNGRQGAAASEASRLRTRGYPPATTGNAVRTDYAVSLVMYRPGYLPEARRLAHDAHVKLVGPLDGLRPAQLKGAQVVLLLGT